MVSSGRKGLLLKSFTGVPPHFIFFRFFFFRAAVRRVALLSERLEQATTPAKPNVTHDGWFDADKFEARPSTSSVKLKC